jgi:transaldolase/glucose-6-phosphate isomerase
VDDVYKEEGMAYQNPLIALNEAGTSVWLDYIRRKLIQSGELQRLIDEDGLRGLTSNPTIFEKSISGSTDYNEQIRALVEQGREPLEIFQIIATDDIRAACDVLRPLYDRLNRYDGYVSIEVSPGAANDTEATLAEARQLWSLVNRPNVMIKVPGTEAGLPAIEQLISEGININITLLFDVENYAQVAECYIRGLEKRLASGQPIDHVASVASFFVSRVDTAVDKQLEAKIAEAQNENEKERLRALLGKAAIANAKIAYERFQQIFRGPRWQKLADAGAMLQRPLWASTSTKNPAYRDVMYVEQLIGPHTVNTMPQATMNAFKDHGIVRQTVTEDVEGAHRTLTELAAVGIDLDAITRQLQIDGVRLFADSFNALIDAIEAERNVILMGMRRTEAESLGTYQDTIDQELKRLTDMQFVRRLWEKDGSLWSDDPDEQREIKNALGWLNIVEPMREQLDDLEHFASQVRQEGYTRAVLLGMGGSSLGPDVLTHTFGSQTGYPQLEVLDTTNPDAISALTQRIDPTRTLFIISSKSGTTTETLSFYRYFWKVVQDAGVTPPGRNFIAITDPGTPLEEEAKRHGFRRIFPGMPDIGGRYSVLSYFGLVPAAIMGLDVRTLLDRAETMVHATQSCVAPHENPGVRLGTIMGVLARAGRDKLTLVLSPKISTFGWWVEQLIAESTGKAGTGILPVEGERLGTPDVYSNDRLFVYLRLRDEEAAESPATEGSAAESVLDTHIHALEHAGHPTVVLELSDLYDLGGEFFLWEIATATAGSLLHINAFNQPNVQESKDNTKRLLTEYEQMGRLAVPEPVLTANGINVAGPLESAHDLAGYLHAFLDSTVKAGSYVALMAYIEPSAAHSELLDTIRLAIRDRYKVATTVGYGPRFLHSTGQLHKGGPAKGVFLQFVTQPRTDLAIPGERYSFGTLITAQALGDFQALQKHGRPVVRLDLGSDVEQGLQAVVSALAGARV